jgi:hypothetical protein
MGLSDKQIPWHRVVYNALLWKVLFLGISHHIFRGIQMAGMVCSWVYCNVKVLDKKQNAKPNICYEGRMFDTAWPGAGWMNV